MNNKGLIFSISLVLITVAALTTLILVIINLEKQISPTKTIGERAIEIANLKTAEEQTQFFIENAAIISAEKATEQFFKNAGLTTKDCGIIENTILWNNADKNCFETNFYQNYQYYFNQQLNPYITVLAEIIKQEIPLNNYELFIGDKKTLSGIALQPIKINLITDTKTTGIYAFKPSFTIPFEHDFIFFQKLKIFSRNIMACGDAKDQQNKEECIQGAMSKTEVPLLMKKIEDNTFEFEIEGIMKFGLSVVLH